MKRLCAICKHDATRHTHYRNGTECSGGCWCPHFKRLGLIDRLLDWCAR